MIIYVGTSFGTSRCIDVFKRDIQLYAEPQIDISFQFTTDPHKCTHAILLNTAMPKLNIPKENVIGIAFEPPSFLGITNMFVKYAQTHIGKYFIGDASGLPEPFEGHHGHMWHIPISMLKQLPSQSDRNKMSIMVSFKQRAPGHIYRHTLVKEILKTSLPVDIWGNGCRHYNYIKDPRIRGTFANEDLRIYTDYQFHIGVENFQTPHYYSEKVINPIICNTVPVYLGCKNIDSYIDGIIHLTGNIEDDMTLIRKICEDKYNTMQNPINRDRLLKTHNIRNVIKQLCDNV